MKKLPSLTPLALPAEEYPVPFSWCPHPNNTVAERSHRLLEHLKLGAGFYDRSLFSTIAGLATSLTSLAFNLDSIGAVDTSHLSTLRSLDIYGEMSSLSNAQLRLLTSTLTACQALKRLRLCNHEEFPSSPPAVDKQQDQARLLHVLPSSLETLWLIHLAFSAEYLVDVLTSPRFPRLRRVQSSRVVLVSAPASIFGSTTYINGQRCRVVYDDKGEDAIEKVCSERRISFDWLGGRKRGDGKSRDDDTSFDDNLREIVAAFADM